MLLTASLNKLEINNYCDEEASCQTSIWKTETIWKYSKKSWEVFFLLYDMDPTKEDASNRFSIVACEFVVREVLIQPLLSNNSLHGASLDPVFQLLVVMSHMCLYTITKIVSSGSTDLAFRR